MTFVGIYVLVYALASDAPFRDRARAALARLAAQERVAISRQVLREYLAVVTRRQSWGEPLSLAAALADTATLSTQMDMLEDGLEVWDRLRQSGQTFVFAGKQVHDANIVATMLAHGETRLLTFNGADFHSFAALIELVTP